MRSQAAALLLIASTARGFAPAAVRAPAVHAVGNAVATRPAALSLSLDAKLAPSSSSLRMSSEAAPAGDGEKSFASKAFDAYTKAANLATTLFPLWTVLFTAVALKKPSAFDFFTTEYFTAALAALMLSMGITLTPADFVAVASEPSSVLMQFSLCYGMMPVLALALGKAFGLDAGLMAGMVLVGSINGGQASNLCTYIAKGNVALSVLMTTATTVGAILMTPFLCKSLLGAVVPSS